MTEYSAGTILSLQLSPYTDHWADPSRPSPATAALAKSPKFTLRVEIIRAFEPFTISVSCQVKVIECIDEQGHTVQQPTGIPQECILKLYDRRHANNMRDTYKGFYAFDPSREMDFQAFLDESRAARDIGLPDPEPSDEIEVELEIHEMVDRAVSCEVSAYVRMMIGRRAGLQPAAPLYYGEVQYESESGTLQGILIEHVTPSVTLTAYLRRASTCGYLQAEVPSICDQVLKTAESIMTFNFIHDDVRTDNVLLHCEDGIEALFDPSVEKKFRAIFIDYGKLRDRQHDETDLEWVNNQDFMGADDEIGRNMEFCLADFAAESCPVHGESCRPPQEGSDMPKRPLWKFIRADTFKAPPPTEEQQKLQDAVGGFWGFYDYRPYPLTLEELNARIAADEAKGFAGESVIQRADRWHREDHPDVHFG